MAQLSQVDQKLWLSPPNVVAEIERQALVGYADNNHALISPSGASRWAKCVGSLIGIHEHRRTATDNPASVEGTVAHYLLELCLLDGICPTKINSGNCEAMTVELKAEVDKWIDNILSKPEQSDDVIAQAKDWRVVVKNVDFPAEMRNHVKRVYDVIFSYVKQGYQLWPEMKVSLKAYFGHSQCDGSSDTVLVKGQHLIIADLKYGVAEEVFPEHNAQASLYGLGAISHVEEYYENDVNSALMPDKYRIRDVSLVICQPRVNDRYWDVWNTTRAELEEYAIGMKVASLKALQAIADPSSVTPEMHVPSDKACKYCHRRASCDSRRTTAFNKAAQAFASCSDEQPVQFVPAPPGQLPEITREKPDIDGIDNETLNRIMVDAPFIQAFLKDIEKEVFKRVQRGQSVGGRKLVKGRKTRKWKCSEEQLVNTLVALGVPKDNLIQVKTNSPAQMDAVILENSVRELVKSMTGESFGQPVVALANDRRESIVAASTAKKFMDAK